ncbi:uncharacterized protein LOC126575202 [Anopheles aquasalis]|uniref:uncharacterized protein LOC126575202 n=1 Tax=Anopheles aquasalis TaxID=42839 RepID=UPI00215A9304|nr:uncharacterized protein LOC126575202 [Anopheles aquasalis]
MSTETNKTTTLKAVKTGRTAPTKTPPNTHHGTDYQLKITLWSLLIVKLNNSNGKYSNCSITAEDPLGGKFDDTVLQFQLLDGSNQSLYIQAKHKHDTKYRITSGDLLSASDKAFSIKMYFESFRELHSKEKTNGAWFVVCTNAGVSQEVTKVLENVVNSSTDDITAIFNRVKDAKIYRFHKEKLRNIEPFKSFFANLTIDNDVLDQFFGKFLLISNMKGTEINNDVIKLWRHMEVPGSSLFTQQMGLIEQAIALDHLSNVAWTMTKFSKTKSETDIEDICQTIVRNLCFLQLKGATSVFCKSFENSDVTIKSEALKQSKTYRACLTGGVHEYCAMLDTEVSCNIILQIVQLVECEYIFTDSKTYLELASVIRDMFCFLECNLVLVIVCENEIETISRSVEELFKDSKPRCRKSVIRITPSERKNDEEEFRVSDLTEQAKQRIFESYSNMKISYAQVSLEYLVNQEDNLGLAVQLIKTARSEQSNTHPCIKSFENIESLYIHRRCKISSINDRDNNSWSETCFDGANYKPKMVSHFKEPTRFDTLAEEMRLYFYPSNTYNHIMQEATEKVYSPPPGMDMDTSDRVIIILEEAGFGKTTYMTWVAWYYVVHRQRSWVIRLNAIEYSFDFKQILEDHGPVLDNNKVVRILFQLIYLALSIPNLTIKTPQETDSEKRKAKRWAECLTLSEGKVVVDFARDASVEQQIALRVFKEKFNEEEIVLLFDGFDEIVPHYKDVVLNLFSHLAQFEGIHKLYFTSRPYNFIDELKDAFKVNNIYRIEPFSTENHFEFLHKYLQCHFNSYGGCVGNYRICLLKILLKILETILGEMRPIPLFFKMVLDIVKPRFMETIDFINYTISPTLFQELETKYGRSRILEAFVNQKLAIANEKKFVSRDSGTATAHAQLDAAELNELKRNYLSLLAIYTIIPSDYQLLTRREQQQCEQYLKKIEHGREKSGIIEGVQGGVPLWIHRMFAEYFTADWLFENSDRYEVVLYLKSKCYWKSTNNPVRKIFDEIAIRDNDGNDSPVHLAIIRNDEIRLKDALTNNGHLQTDAIGRTPLHLAVQYLGDIGISRYEDCFFYLEEMNIAQKSLIIDAKDNLLHWSALDYAFRIYNSTAIKYLLENNASINVIALSEQLQGHDPSDSSETLARYDKYVMDFAHDIDNHKPRSPHSAQQIENMRTVCNNVITHIKNNHSEWFEANITNILLTCFARDSVLLLNLLASETDFITTPNETEVYETIAKASQYPFHIFGFLYHEHKIDISGPIDDDAAYKLLRYCLLNGYKKWFAYFLNLCSSVLNNSGRRRWDACDSNMAELLFVVIKYGSTKLLQQLFNTVLLAIDPLVA